MPIPRTPHMELCMLKARGSFRWFMPKSSVSQARMYLTG